MLVQGCGQWRWGREAGTPHAEPLLGWPRGSLRGPFQSVAEVVGNRGTRMGASIFCGLLRPQHKWQGQGHEGISRVAWDDGSVGRREAGGSMETASEPGPKGDDRKAHLDLKPELFSSGMGGLWRE